MRSDLLDRDAETAVLSAALSPAARPEGGSVVLISGPLGIGRSALLNLAGNLAVAGGLRVGRAAGARLERNFGLCLARELLCPLLPATGGAGGYRESARAVIARSALSGASVLLSAEEAHGEHRMALDSVALAVEVVARRRPLALLVDDLQWSDEPSLRVLARLALLARTAPVTLVMTILDGDGGGDRALIREITALAEMILRPGPLSGASIAALVAGLPDAGALAERLNRECGGIPLLLTAGLAEAAGARGGCEPGSRIGVRDKVGAVLAAQPAVVRRYAMAAIVVGDDVDPDVIGRLLDLDPVEAVRVRHALAWLGLAGPRAASLTRSHLRDLAKEWLSIQDQEALRLRAAAMMYEGGARAEQIVGSLPFVPLPAPWVPDLILSAADAARASEDMGTAARCLRLALRAIGPTAAGRGPLLAQLAAAEHALGEVAAIRHLSDAMLSMPDPSLAAAVAVNLPAAAFASAPDWLHDQLLAVAAKLPVKDRLGPAPQIALNVAARLLSAGQERLRDQPLTRWVTEIAPEPELLTWADRELEAVHLREMTLAASRPAKEVAVRLDRVVRLEPVSPAQLHAMLPLVLPAWYATENAPSALAWLEAVVAQNLPHPSQADVLMVLAVRAAVRLRHGDLAQAVSLTERACAEISRDVLCQGRSAWVFYGVALAARDLRLSHEVLSAFRPREEHEGLVERALRQLLEASSVLARSPHQALAKVEDFGRGLEQVGWQNPALVPWRLWAARLHRRLGRTELAMSRISEELKLAEAWGAPAGVCRALRARALAAPARSRREYLTKAHELVSSSPDQLEQARVLLALAGTMPAGDAVAARHLRQAMALAEKCGAAELVAQSRQQLARSGFSIGRDTASLTQAEWRVASLAAHGRTNSAIATELGITRRAVEKHLTSCYRKLSIDGRSGLVTVLGDSVGQQRAGPVNASAHAIGLGVL